MRPHSSNSIENTTPFNPVVKMRSHPWLAAHPYKEVPLPPGGHPENVASLELQLGVCLCMYSDIWRYVIYSS